MSPPVEEACPDEEEIAAFVRGGMAPRRMRAMEAHVARCAECRTLLSALAQAATLDVRPGDDSVSPTLPVDTGTGTTELPLRTRFGRYLVLDWLGAGGMGVVYSAHDPELNRRVALKVLRGGGGSGDGEGGDRAQIRALLQSEAQAMAQLAHPNVVTVFDVGSVDDRVFIAMELVEGQTLSAWLRAEPRTPSEIVAMFVAAGNGLAAAHTAGLIHRDFKPDNVLVGNDGRVRVTDFGLARSAVRETRDAEADGDAPSGLAGTPAYMAPELLQQRAPDARADQYSFSVALYEALYGQRPFVSSRHVDAGPALRPLSVTTPRGTSVPAALRQVLLRGLSPEPDDRYASMTELLAA
ncbi:MAG: protein kinase, partial [Myxococcales bacterium]|nr:protein kinase [Myxococcales bacterium]